MTWNWRKISATIWLEVAYIRHCETKRRPLLRNAWWAKLKQEFLRK